MSRHSEVQKRNIQQDNGEEIDGEKRKTDGHVSSRPSSIHQKEKEGPDFIFYLCIILFTVSVYKSIVIRHTPFDILRNLVKIKILQDFLKQQHRKQYSERVSLPIKVFKRFL
ncbi:hypothetical protein CDAR_311741 [Caerostris darwini]|uniref:Uncharacterized protein n=1 Tax=Caerostris darwini TaxID=1538125 RepID=A0AAV4TNX5_9ARAC|nr:hypothetical protein CDAR_311741 [Caerostris darwini]